MKLVLAYYNDACKALSQGANVEDLVKLAVRERIGRFKYTTPDAIEAEYQSVLSALAAEIAKTLEKEDL